MSCRAALLLLLSSSDTTVAQTLAAKVTEPLQRCVGLRASLPTECTKGNDLWSIETLRAYLPGFATWYSSKPQHETSNFGGMHANHAFALWVVVKRLNPTHIIESGVFLGFSTFLMRSAAPKARIICLDPRVLADDKYYFHDPSPLTTYLTGHNFIDFAAVEWAKYVPMRDRPSTLVMFDDHMSAIRRVKEMLDLGFQHLFYEDNLSSDAFAGYSFNILCTPPKLIPLPKGWPRKIPPSENNYSHLAEGVAYVDWFGEWAKLIPLHKHQSNVRFLNNHLREYYEFPAIYDGCPNKGGMQSMYAHFEDVLKLGFKEWNPKDGVNAGESWLHNYPAYVRLQPSRKEKQDDARSNQGKKSTPSIMDRLWRVLGIGR